MTKNNKSGFTIVELLVASFLMVAIGAGLVGLQYILGDTQNRAFTSFNSVSLSNYAVSSIVRELRTAQPGDNGAYPISLAADNEIIFFSDYDFDGDVERVHYYLDNGELMRGIVEPTGFPVSYPLAQEKIKPITGDIKNTTPIFLYFNGNWPSDTTNNPLPTPADLSETKYIRVNLVINPSNDPAQDYDLDSFVTIRMLKQNL